MSVDLRDTCPLGVSDETLSALRDEALPAGELRRLNEHAATCPACAQRLEGYERLGRLLRDQRLPGSAPALWNDVRGSILARQSLPVRSQWRTVVSPRLGTLGAVAAVLLVALLFGFVLHALPNGATTLATPTASAAITDTPPPTLTPTATAWPVQTPVPGPQLSWHYYTLPGGYAMDPPHGTLTVAPSDGSTAYYCGLIVSPNQQVLQPAGLLATHDQGQHWRQVSAGPLLDCTTVTLAVDETDPMVAIVGRGAGTYRTLDGGSSWQVVNLSQFVGIGQFATMGSTMFAAVRVSDPSINGTKAHLEESGDGMQTWQPIDGGITDGEVRFFWLNASSGNLLAATDGGFWQSGDGGTSWSKLAFPARTSRSWYNYVVRPAERGWQLCSVVACTTDGGQTWRALPPLLSGVPGGRAEFPLAIAGNGSLLAMVYALDQANLSREQIGLYRLPAGTTQWQSLGLVPTLPPDGLDLYPAFGPTIGGAGVFWALPPGGKGAYSQFYTAPYAP